MNAIARVDAQSLFEQTLARIREAICDGTLGPNERLTQDRIAERLNVSRMPVNQALLMLKAQGFVIDAGRRGVRVAPIEPATAREIYEIRSVLDPLAARLAAARPAPAPARAESAALLAAGQAELGAQSFDALIRADMAFHDHVYQRSGNRLMAAFFGQHADHLRRVMQVVLLAEPVHQHFWDEHRAMLDAIDAGDGARAEALARAHIEGASRSVELAFAADGGATAAPDSMSASGATTTTATTAAATTAAAAAAAPRPAAPPRRRPARPQGQPSA